ncbi:MAG: serine hydrolase domain-containing protein [Chitinophagia bacterium]|jgi:CubicO group peptidase (beta-lactamase class C family)
MKIKITAIVLTLAFVFSKTSYSQVLSFETVKSNKFDYTKLAQIDSLVNKYVHNRWLIGSTVIIVKDNQVVYHKGFGYINEASKKPMPSNPIYRIMSQTKAITSLAIMQLFEQGKIGLDQKVSSIITSFKNPKVLKDFNPKDSSYTTIPAKREVTIRDLLTHTSGIDYTDIGTPNMGAIYTKAGIPSGLGDFNASLLDRMKVLGGLPLLHQPGERFTYGLNSDLLGCIVEVISGLSLEAYCQKNIFDPLGMKDTYFNVPTAKANRMPTVYTENDDHQIIEWSPTFRNINPNYPIIPKTYFSGGAGLSSTAYDYAIFLQMIMNGGKYNGKQIIAPRTAAIMVSPQNDTDDFSLGFSITSEKSANLNLRNKGSFSWGGYYGTAYWADPKDKMVVLIMTQQNPNSHGEITGIIERMIYGSMVN